jgi:hypothetical protein
MDCLIETATELAAELRRKERIYQRASHVIDNALRSARITKVGTGILHRQPVSYEQELLNVEKALDVAKSIVLELQL